MNKNYLGDRTPTTQFQRHYAVPVSVPGKSPKETKEQTYQEPPLKGSSKSQLTAGLLGIFLGAFGIHNFYLGYTVKGVIQVLLTVVGCCFFVGPVIAGIWGLVEGILLLTGNISKDGHNNPLVD